MKNKYSKIKINNDISYDGKLNNHEEYLKMLNILETKCKFIGILAKHEIIDRFKDDTICIEKTNSWWGIETSYTATIYYIKSSKELFKFLEKYETFCKYIFNNYRKTGMGDEVVITNFGTSDIAFFDKNDQIILKTNTHEGFIIVNSSIDDLFTK